MTATDDDVIRVRAEIANLEFAARSFREAANVLRVQRDGTKREACALRQRVRIATMAMAATVLLAVGAVAYAKAADGDTRVQQMVRITRVAAITVELRVVPGTAESTGLTDDDRHAVYEIWVADG